MGEGQGEGEEFGNIACCLFSPSPQPPPIKGGGDFVQGFWKKLLRLVHERFTIISKPSRTKTKGA